MKNGGNNLISLSYYEAKQYYFMLEIENNDL